jgi:2-methylcitrate dehydratase PrpD
MTLSRTLAEHFATVDYAAFAGPQRHEMRRLLLDQLGVAFGGSRTDSGRIAGEFAIELGGTPEATVLGTGVRVPAVHAAFANAVAGHSLELDDVDELALFHYGPPIVGAALATAQRVGAPGSALVDALLAGCELMARLSRAVNPALRDRGFHTTPTVGAFGAAVAAGRLLGLDAARLADALGLAGAQASGLMEMYGPSMQKRVNTGPAARNGVTAALLAARGFTGADTILDGERGFGRAFADGLDPDPVLDGLGAAVPVHVEYKPYACARPIHNAIDCALELRERLGIGAADIAELTVYRHPAWADYHRNPRPRTYHEAQVSLPYSVALAFAEGRAMPDQYADERLGESPLTRVAQLVLFETDPALPRGVSCRMTVVTTSGARGESQVDDPLGSLARPLSDEQLAAKFAAVTAAERARPVAEAILAIDEVDDVNAVVDLCETLAR